MKTIVIDGKVYAWKQIPELRRRQILDAKRIQQLTLFDLKQDPRPVSQQTTEGRYREPLLFKE